MSLSVGFWLILVLLLILFSAFFAATEIGMMSLNRYRLRHLVKSNNRQAILVQEQLNHPERLLSSVLIGNTLANILASMAMTFVGQKLYREAGVAIAEIFLTIVILVFAEMAPKTWAALHPEKVAFRFIYPLRILQFLLKPLSFMTTYLSQHFLNFMGVSSAEMGPDKISFDELRAVMNETEGLLPKEHQSMLVRLLDLERAQVEDVMIPKNEIHGIDITESWMDIVEHLMHAQHTRIPLYEKSIDHLVGVVHARNVMQLFLNQQLDIEHLLKNAEKPIYIPAGTSLTDQILQFRAKNGRSGFVVNEYGDLLGLVTLEDILEEVVGDFTTDMADIYQDIIQKDKDDYLIDASISLKQLSRVLGWNFPQMGPRTLSGLIIEHLGYIPAADSCLMLLNDYQVTILRVSAQMIKTVRMKKIS
ncbi:MAG: magnesium and cobalt exporter, family [Pseudomonadota bacterium]|nr:magnesium and cobalt exporter, family [Pseudomonadota bacterium]